MFRLGMLRATRGAAILAFLSALGALGASALPAPAAPMPAALARTPPMLRAWARGPFAQMMLRAGYTLTPRAFPAGRALLSPALEYPLYNFGAAPDGSGANPLIADAAGSLYGTTFTGGKFGNGTVYKLTPPAPGLTAWTETILHSFTGGSDGGTPFGSLVFDKYGALYGTTNNGGLGAAPGFGTVFKLAPPSSIGGTWSESVIYAFTGGDDGANPGIAVLPIGGALYSTNTAGGTFNAGTAFKLTPPASPGAMWNESTLFAFGGPGDGVDPFYNLVLKDGALFTTLSAGGPYRCSCGTVVALTPPAAGTGPWTETTLHAFNGVDGNGPGPLIESGGALYGITQLGGGGGSLHCAFFGCGEVFQLARYHAKWTESLILALDGSDGYLPTAIAADGHGNLYGAAFLGGVYGFGDVFRLTPRNSEKNAWRVSVLHAFACGADSGSPGTLEFLHGGLYGTTVGTASAQPCGNGQIFQLR
jgi:uncharacterized repeat protein (TIGR03803 family)